MYNIYNNMKLLKTIEKIIQEAEDQYESACNSYVSEKEIERAEKNYRDSLKLLNVYMKTISE